MENLSQGLVLIGFGMILLELLIGIQTGFDLVLLGSILVIGGGVGAWVGNYLLALGLSAGLSLIYIWFGRKAVKRGIEVKLHKSNADKVVGESGIVTEKIESHRAGRVKLIDEEWRAVADEEIETGSKVRVKSVEGVSLKVIKL